MSFDDYHVNSADWRQQLKDNERKTKFVIAAFIGLFLLVGLLFDTLLNMGTYQLPIKTMLYGLLTFQVFPVATVIMFMIAGGALLLTYRFHDKMMLLGTNSHEVTGLHANTHEEQQLYHVVEEMKVAAGMKFMPKVYVIEADYMNAFASGYSEKSAIVAITTGLMQKLNRAELQAVMAHELTHIRHQDIKLTLTVSVLSNILLIAIDRLFYSLLYQNSATRNTKGQNSGQTLFMVVMVLRFVLPLVTALLVLFLSRTREYMADSGAVQLMRDNTPLASALLKIHADYEKHQSQYAKAYAKTPHESVRRAAYIFDASKLMGVRDFSDILTTHPSLKKRLAAIGFKQKTR